MVRIPINIMNRHLYLSQHDAELLFWKGVKLTLSKKLSQPEQFIACESVSFKGPLGIIDKIPIIWPWRKQTQATILLSDNPILWITAPIRRSWNLKWSADISVVGPKWSLSLKESVIVAQRCLHLTVAEAKHMWLYNNQTIKIRVPHDERWLIFDNVIVKIRDNFVLDFHIDTDEANAAGIGSGSWWEII